MSPVEEALEEILARVEGGEELDLETFLAERLDVAAEVRTRLRALERAGLWPPRTEPQIDVRKRSFEQRYELHEELGRGGMGRVVRARDRVLDREVAVKLLDVAGGPRLMRSSVERFLAEARTMARLEHPGIVPIHDAGRIADGTPYLTMKLVPGGTLKERLRAWGEGESPEPGLRAKLELVAAAARAVQSAHERGVLHRDLKPSNLLVGEFGEVLVTDWGLARLEAGATGRGSPGSAEHTATGDVVGTPRYMAPEQARRESTDGRTDVWGLGAVLFQLLTGAPPRTGRDLDRVLDDAREGRWDEAALSHARVPRALRRVCRRALASEPAQRYASPGELADDLDAYLRGEPGRAWKDPLVVRFARRVRRRPLLTTWALVLVAAGVASLELWRARAAQLRAELPGKVEAELAQWSSVRQGRMLGNDEPSIVDWARRYVQASDAALEGLGLPPRQSASAWRARLRAMRVADPKLERRVLDELYLHAFALFKGAAVNVQRLLDGLPQPSGPARQGNEAGWRRIAEGAPEIADAFALVSQRLPLVEPRAELRHLWARTVHWMETSELDLAPGLALEDLTASELVLRARLLAEAARVDEARVCLDVALRSDPGRVAAHRTAVEALRRIPAEERDEADERQLLLHLHALAVLEPGSAWAVATYGEKLFELDREAGMAWVEEGVSIDPRVAAPVARAMYAEDPGFATDLVARAAERVPEDAYTAAMMAQFAHWNGDLDAELEWRRRHVGLSREVNPKINLALVLSQVSGLPALPADAKARGLLEDAADLWSQILEAQPGYNRAAIMLGLVELCLGEHERGLSTLEASLERRREDAGRETPDSESLARFRDEYRGLLSPPILELVAGAHLPEASRARAERLVEEMRAFASGSESPSLEGVDGGAGR